MLSRDWNQRKTSYDFVIIGSGYGGAITAARLATANLNPKPSICILERGKEWKVGEFPDTMAGYLSNLRDVNPLGLYEILNYPEISVIKGSGLGGTSLVNANVAIVPDEGIFKNIDGWPKDVTLGEMLPYYTKARDTLAAGPHPRFGQLPKVHALKRRATEAGLAAEPLNIAVNFTIDGNNAHGVAQKPCTDCGDCVTGCNVGAKNTLQMNYLPIAANSGAEIYTQTKVEFIEKLPGGGWRVSGKYLKKPTSRGESFSIEARNVILAAGAINSTEILLRSSQLHGLNLSPAIGTRFGGNGDFFGISYNGDQRTQVLGFGNHPNSPGKQFPPGPTIVGIMRYAKEAPVGQRFNIEDLSFPKAYVNATQLAFAALRGEDTDAGDEAAERERIARDFFQTAPYQPDGAVNHSMLYLCMGIDDAGGYFKWERPFFERDGRVSVRWPGVGRQSIFGTINEELRRHARANGGSFVANPLWSFLNVGRLVTAHPLGGCPMGDNYVEGAVDQFGRVYSGDGSVHQGLFVADGSIIPSALGVNPFLTISALAERIAARKIRDMQGDAYPQPEVHAGFDLLDPVDVAKRSETELERIFETATTMPLADIVNAGGRNINQATGRIRNDDYWKGFFPAGNILNAMSAAIWTGFKKAFSKSGSKFTGLTSDTDGRITARNSLEMVEIKETTGDLKPGKYILLKYLDAPWQGFYDIFKLVNKDLLIGRVYLGTFPNGRRMFTFPMTRVYSFDSMTAADHRTLFDTAPVPTGQDLQGVWRMDVISNANSTAGMAFLEFDNKPDGRLETRFQLLGLIEGLVVPTLLPSHFQLNDFTPFHDEIRSLGPDLMIGKWVTNLPVAFTETSAVTSLGIFHYEPKQGANTNKFGFYYLLRRGGAALPTSTLLSPLLNAHLPRGIGMIFDETMEGAFTPNGGAETTCKFTVRMNAADLNDFIEGPEHEARISGNIEFGTFGGVNPPKFPLDAFKSYFNYLRVNPTTGEAEMRYHLEFDVEGKRHTLEGRKFMQKDAGGAVRGPQEVLEDYTTLFVTVHDEANELGKGILKFRTFEDLFAVGNLAGFLRSFRVTGTQDIGIQLMGQLRFLAFTGQFVQSEYDPLALPVQGVGAGG